MNAAMHLSKQLFVCARDSICSCGGGGGKASRYRPTKTQSPPSLAKKKDPQLGGGESAKHSPAASASDPNEAHPWNDLALVIEETVLATPDPPIPRVITFSSSSSSSSSNASAGKKDDGDGSDGLQGLQFLLFDDENEAYYNPKHVKFYRDFDKDGDDEDRLIAVDLLREFEKTAQQQEDYVNEESEEKNEMDEGHYQSRQWQAPYALQRVRQEQDPPGRCEEYYAIEITGSFDNDLQPTAIEFDDKSATEISSMSRESCYAHTYCFPTIGFPFSTSMTNSNSWDNNNYEPFPRSPRDDLPDDASQVRAWTSSKMAETAESRPANQSEAELRLPASEQQGEQMTEINKGMRGDDECRHNYDYDDGSSHASHRFRAWSPRKSSHSNNFSNIGTTSRAQDV